MCLALLALLVLAAPASAHVPHADKLVEIAEQRFPDHCDVEIRQASFVDGYEILGAFHPETCDITFATDEVLHGGDWPMEDICGVMVHEVGHAAGVGHSDDPDNIMHSWGPRNPVARPECENVSRHVPRWRAERKAHRRLLAKSNRRALRRYRACSDTHLPCVRRASKTCGKHRRMDCWRYIAARV